MHKMPRKVLLTDTRSDQKKAQDELEKAALLAEREKHRAPKVYRDDDVKIEVVKTFIALGGNLALTSGVTGISYHTLKDWKVTAWWKNLLTEIKQHEKIELSAKTKRIMSAALDVLADRVLNGDFIYDQRSGKLVRKPITAKDAHVISMDLMEKVEFLDKVEDTSVDTKDRDLARLEALADKFAKLANKIDTRPPVQVVDVVFAEETKSAENQES